MFLDCTICVTVVRTEVTPIEARAGAAFTSSQNEPQDITTTIPVGM